MTKRWILPVAAVIGIGAVTAGCAAPDRGAEDKQRSAQNSGLVRFVPDNLFAVSFTSARNGWAAGYYGTFLQTKDGGQSWIRRPIAGNDLIRRARFIDDRTGWAVSHRGKILFTSDGGEKWTVQHDAPGIYLRDVFMLDSQTGWVVGHAKTILHTVDGGRTWTPQTFAHSTQDPPRLNAIAAFDAMNAIAVGEFGTLIRTSDGGNSWSPIAAPAQTTYTAIAVAGDHAIAVGLTGVIISIPRSGGPAKLIPTPAPLHLLDVTLDAAGNGFAVGTGIAYRIAGETVTPIKLDAPQGADLIWLGGVDIPPGGTAIAVGAGGLMMRYDPAANSFKPMRNWAG